MRIPAPGRLPEDATPSPDSAKPVLFCQMPSTCAAGSLRDVAIFLAEGWNSLHNLRYDRFDQCGSSRAGKIFKPCASLVGSQQ
ncbi:hypothetical protein [Comamonas kerstersii]|uniref:hypothetical protein n=1 Tax=Comamonas kerstersii TaxID=225992 RepID=UPI001B87F9A3|nr:hypothetical protein [Comamonas kerstersii]